jgi:hypothetical protein
MAAARAHLPVSCQSQQVGYATHQSCRCIHPPFLLFLLVSGHLDVYQKASMSLMSVRRRYVQMLIRSV